MPNAIPVIITITVPTLKNFPRPLTPNIYGIPKMTNAETKGPRHVPLSMNRRTRGIVIGMYMSQAHLLFFMRSNNSFGSNPKPQYVENMSSHKKLRRVLWFPFLMISLTFFVFFTYLLLPLGYLPVIKAKYQKEYKTAV